MIQIRVKCNNIERHFILGECDGQQQYNTYGDEEPVYEEIQSRTTENCDANDYEDEVVGGKIATIIIPVLESR